MPSSLDSTQTLRGIGRETYRRGPWYSAAFVTARKLLGRELTGLETRAVEAGWQAERAEVVS